MKYKAITGIMLTLLFIGMLALGFDVQPIEADPELQLTLGTDKDVYILGENVMIILTNVSNETVWFHGYPAWEIFTYPEGEHVFPSVFTFLLWSLEPGENDTITWNQFNEFTGIPVEPGMFVINDTQGRGLSTYFEIYAPPPPVGGIYIPINKLDLLAPYIGLTTLLAVAVMAVAYVKKRKRNRELQLILKSIISFFHKS